MMTKPVFPTESLKLVQQREASVSIGASTARGMPQGTVKAARDFLRTVELREFGTESAEAFRNQLDTETRKLTAKLPARKWGAARKFLNIFLRGALYNRYLCAEFDLQKSEHFFEVPLDSSVATGLHGEDGGDELPTWISVISLLPEVSDRYQGFAQTVARRKKVARVHLDLFYFRPIAPP